MPSKFFANFNRVLGIDLGTSRTRIWHPEKGVVIDEPTAIAVDNKSGKVIAVGREAAQMQGRVTKNIIVHRPVQDGKLYDAVVAKAMLRVWLPQVLGAGYLFSPIIMVSLPASSTAANREAVVELMSSIGAREVYTIAQPLAAAIGAGVPIADSSGSLVFQIGAGVAEAALISLGSMVASESSWKAGHYLDTQIQQVIKEDLILDISLEVAEKIKTQVSSVVDPSNQSLSQKINIVGQDAINSAPKELEISDQNTAELLLYLADHYQALLKKLLSQIPPELITDVLDKGMLLSGSMARLTGLEEYLVKTLGVPVSVLEDPDLAVIEGIATALQHLDLFKDSLGSG